MDIFQRHYINKIPKNIVEKIKKYISYPIIFIIYSKECQYCRIRDDKGYLRENIKILGFNCDIDFYKNLITGYTNNVKFRVFEVIYEKLNLRDEYPYEVSEYILNNDQVICLRYNKNNSLQINYSNMTTTYIDHINFEEYLINNIPFTLKSQIIAYPNICIIKSHNLFENIKYSKDLTYSEILYKPNSDYCNVKITDLRQFITTYK